MYKCNPETKQKCARYDKNIQWTVNVKLFVNFK